MNEIKTTEDLAPLMLRLLIAQNAAARAKLLAKKSERKSQKVMDPVHGTDTPFPMSNPRQQTA